MPKDPPPSALATHLGYLLRMVSNGVSHGFARLVEREGVTVAEWVFLRVLYDVDRLAPSRLAEGMGMTRGAISKLADRLLAKSLIESLADPDDKRAHTLALTAAGRALVPRLARLADQNDAAFFAPLGPDERRCLEHLLRKMIQDHGLAQIPID